MAKLQALTDVRDLKYLLSLYRKHSPNANHGFYTLKNFIHWLELNPKIDYVNVYVLENWKESGLFIIQDRYHLFINILKFLEDEVSQALNLWDWSRKYKIVALPAILYGIVEKTLKELNVNIRKFNLKIFQRDRCHKNSAEIHIPDFLVLKPLKIDDAILINDTWYSRQEGSLQFIQTLIKFNISYGLYIKKTDELVAWCTRCQCGFLGTLHVKEQYRGQGLATILIESFSENIFKQGEEVRTMINEKNEASQKLFSKLGFKSHEDVFIVYSEP